MNLKLKKYKKFDSNIFVQKVEFFAFWNFALSKARASQS